MNEYQCQTVVIISTGNVATVLGSLLVQKGHKILQVYGRKLVQVQALAQMLSCEGIDDLDQLTKEGDIYIIAVSDSSVASIAEQIHLKNKLVLHTAGSLSKDILANSSNKYGVLWPIQTIRKEMTSIPSIPFGIEGSDDSVTQMILAFANTISEKVVILNEENRRKLHLSAIMTANFSNHLFALVDAYCTKHQLPFNVLLPLLEETTKRLKHGKAINLQTGPAVRGDYSVIQKHHSLLKEEPNLLTFYEMFTTSIQTMYAKKEDSL